MEGKYIPKKGMQLIRQETLQTIPEKTRQQINVSVDRKKSIYLVITIVNVMIKRINAHEDAMMILIISTSFEFPFLRAILRYRVRYNTIIGNNP